MFQRAFLRRTTCNLTLLEAVAFRQSGFEVDPKLQGFRKRSSNVIMASNVVRQIKEMRSGEHVYKYKCMYD